MTIEDMLAETSAEQAETTTDPQHRVWERGSVTVVPDDPSANGERTNGANGHGVDQHNVGAASGHASSAVGGLRRQAGRRRRLGLLAADATAVASALTAAWVLFGAPSTDGSTTRRVIEMVGIGVVWMIALAAKRLYATRCVERLAEEISRLMIAGLGAIIAFIAAYFVVDAPLPNRSWTVGIFALVSGALLLERAIARHVFARLRATGRLTRPIAVIGADAEAAALAHSIEHDQALGYDVVGLVGSERAGQEVGGYPVIGSFNGASAALAEHGCVGAIVSIASVEGHRVNSLTRELAEREFHVALSTNLRDIDVTRMRPQGLDGEVLIYVEPAIRTGWRQAAKRVFDVIVASLALLVNLPILLLAAVLIKLDSRGPVLFRQERVGRDGEIFHMLKLRTMVVDAEERKDELADQNEADGPMFKITEDPRMTRIGRFLRRTSLDEFPQFWNVLRNEMSVVGPRPALPEETLGWDGDLFKRLSVPPGITGIWQVSGRSNATFEQYRRLDLYYVDNWSLAHDLEVVAKTFWAVIWAKGAS